jgi:PAS domain S-box-containing protein
VTPTGARRGTVTSRDLTERARALERVSEEREELARLVDALPVLVTVYDPALATAPSGAIRLNRAFVETLGWTEADARAGDLMALCYPDGAVRAAAAAHMARPAPTPGIATGAGAAGAAAAAGADGGAPAARSGPEWLEVPTRAKDGRAVPVLWTNVRLAGDRQVGVGVDLTDRKAAEAALEAERTLLQAVLAQLPVGVSVAEAPSGRVLYTNPLGEQLLGAPVAQVDASQYARYGALHDDGRPYAADEYPLVRALGGAMVDQEVMRYRRGDGRETFIAVSAAPVYDARGRLVRAVATWSDVAERVALEDALRRARDAADAANRAKGAFLATMSHELRTPLNAISGHVQLLEMGLHGAVTDAQQDALGRVQRAQRHLLRLINDILNFARLEAGAVAFAVEAVPVASVIDDVRPMIEPQLAAKGLAFGVDLPDPALAVWADREKLVQVLLNLLSNAVKFTPARQADGSPGRVVVAVAGRAGAPDVAYLRVGDTGVGIPRDKQDAVFQPFVQVDARLTRTQEGTGLGLAISRDLARGMGGDLRVRSAEGAGSVFTVALRRVATADGRPTDRRRADDRRVIDERRRSDDRRRGG